ncbi:MAG: hypothetical protein UW26_C0002G0047 [Candidatus Collierbacteria bacterium GW2011_GWF1_44_12]|uniref:Uncharacterized protein n=1 Tax=Candidatus Collierbacteria bacterium GW2011_GWF1_44_12 TaxID=1618402 RepID=A0A0G1J5U8_9BACT|nr:MAG: hypothetical protein UW26_C0002G0047 [Candidatus Collierbacteria bacterium GW2011_GWF1_44_12]
MINIIDLTLAVLEADEIFYGTDDIIDRKSDVLFINRGISTELAVKFIAAYQPKVVAAGIKEHLVEKGFGIIQNSRFTGADLLVELEESLFGVGGGVF